MSYAQPSPPKIHTEGLIRRFLLSFRNLTSSSSAFILSSASRTALEATLDSSPSYIWSIQFCPTSLKSACFSIRASTAVLAASRLVFIPRCIPRPNSALSSNNELAQAGPHPFSLVVYGVAGALNPQIEEHPVALATNILSPNS